MSDKFHRKHSSSVHGKFVVYSGNHPLVCSIPNVAVLGQKLSELKDVGLWVFSLGSNCVRTGETNEERSTEHLP